MMAFEAGEVLTAANLNKALVVKRVRVASTANVTLASDVENGDTLDGVTLATGDRVLLKDQSSGAENGIYTVNASGAPTRAFDFDSNTEVQPDTLITVSEGTSNADSIWKVTNAATITVGTTALTFFPVHLEGAGTPESAVTAPIGALFQRTDGSTGTTLYVKESGTGNTGWVAVGSATSGVDELVLDANALVAANNSAVSRAMLNNQVWSIWLFDSATTEYVSGQVRVPTGWSTVDLELFWTNDGAGSGNVRWGYAVLGISDTEDLSTSVSYTQSTVAAPATDILKVTTLASGVSVTAGDVLAVAIQRAGGHADDTLGNDAAVLAVRLVKAS